VPRREFGLDWTLRTPIYFFFAHDYVEYRNDQGVALMDWGLQNRLARIIRPATGHTVMLAVDHGYFLGPTSRLENPRETIAPLVSYADALMPTRGVLRTSVDPKTQTPIVLRVSGGTSIIGPSLADEEITTTFEEAIRMNVSAVALSIFVGTEYEHQTLMNLADLVNEGETYGIPVLAVTAVGKELGKRDARFLSLSCRIAAELGAHFVKTYYCEDFEKVVEGCPVPVVIAGGPKLDTMKDVLQLTHDAIKRGAVGVDMGRNIWQSDHPVAAIRAVRAIVHEKYTIKKALDLFEDLKGKKK
jgi:putative autoinducer-2 (AI-2) aldolase